MTSFRGFSGRVKSGLLNMLMLSAWELSDIDGTGVLEAALYVQAAAPGRRTLARCRRWPRSSDPIARPIPGLRAIVVSADLLSEEARAKIEACFKVPVYNRYGGRDIKFVAQECTARQGLHINAENVLVEIVKDGQSSAAGAVGRDRHHAPG